jgi:hypothetical protein
MPQSRGQWGNTGPLYPGGPLLKLIAAALPAALLAAGLAAPEAFAADPAPTNVHVSWKDETFRQVRVTWDESTPQPNMIVLRPKGSTGSAKRYYFPVDAPNVLDVYADTFPFSGEATSVGPLEFTVAAGTPAGDTSPATPSETFDAVGANVPELVSFSMSGTSTIQVKWKSQPLPADTTPNDPLDRTVPITFAPRYTALLGGTQIAIGTPGPATQVTFIGPKPAYVFTVVAHNEWGDSDGGARVIADQAQVTAKVPAWAVYQSGTSKITGTYAPTQAWRQVVLQARNTSTSPWYVVGTTTSRDGRFSFTLGTGGSRQYRVAIPNAVEPENVASFGVYSAPAASTTQLSTLARFSYTQIGTGSTNQAELTVFPAVNTTATLQRWNGKAWATVGPVKVTNGRGVGYIRTASPSRVAYRYYVPASTYGGLYFAAAYTQTFVNDVF